MLHELKCWFNGVAEEPDRVVESNFGFFVDQSIFIVAVTYATG